MICIKKDLKEKAPGVDTSNVMSIMMAVHQMLFNDVDPSAVSGRLPEEIFPRIEGLI